VNWPWPNSALCAYISSMYPLILVVSRLRFYWKFAASRIFIFIFIFMLLLEY
jgi:hypothetical protein